MGLLDDARNKTNSDAVAWRPEERGEGVEGTVLSVTYKESDYQEGVMIPTVTLEQADGTKVRVIGFRSVLRREIESENPQPGDQMAAVYMGTDKLKTGKFAGKPVHVYRCVVQKTNATGSTNGATPTPDATDQVPF